MNKLLSLLTLGLLAVANAAPPDVTTLTDAVDFSTVQTGIMTVGGVVLGVYIVYKAYQFIAKAIKSA